MNKRRSSSPEWFPEESWELHQSAANLTQYACIVSSRHIKDGVLRGRFNRTMAYYVRQILEDVRSGRIRTEEGLRRISIEHKQLQKSALDVVNQVGGAFAGGVTALTGAGICYVSAMTACGIAGLPMIAHGSNNFYENTANLWTGRSDTVGPLKSLYQKAAVSAGGTKSQGTVAYGLVDMGLAGYGLFRPVLRPGAWRLFAWTGSDYVPAYTLMGKGGLFFEAYMGWVTANGVRKEFEE